MRGQRRREREYAARREGILEAAQRVFAKKGYHEATIAEIAKESEYAPGSIYLYFKGKQQLFLALIEGKFKHLLTLVEEATRGPGNPIERLGLVVRTVLEFFETNEEFFKIYINNTTGFECEIEDEIGKGVFSLYLRYVDMVIDLIQEGKKLNYLKDIDARKMGHSLIGMVNSFLFQWLRNPEQGSVLQDWEELMEIFLHGCQK